MCGKIGCPYPIASVGADELGHLAYAYMGPDDTLKGLAMFIRMSEDGGQTWDDRQRLSKTFTADRGAVDAASTAGTPGIPRLSTEEAAGPGQCGYPTPETAHPISILPGTAASMVTTVILRSWQTAK
jgi:hypothetical protein